ncbi:MAG: hypothetical protein II914_00755 [Clostridia bacterium]|nr:hypothetical protein [Clostridia bacterium]MBR0444984.1 hypothetical protein [Clostridia bacterium]
MNGKEKRRTAGALTRRQLHVLLSEEESEKIETLCSLSGLSYTMLIKKLLLSQEIRQRPDVNFYLLARSVDRLNSSLNLTVRKIYGENTVTDGDMKEALRIMKEVRSEIEEWKKKWL